VQYTYIRGLIIFWFLLVVGWMHGQQRHASPRYFGKPVSYKYYVSGNFCELRESHYHAGIDIKSCKCGVPDSIVSIGEGYVSRIRVDAGGYGKCLYLDHPASGYTSVYAHLDRFNESIEAMVFQKQQETECYEVDFIPEPHIFPVQKGSFIGILGNTGYSFGPHLHFEVRDTKKDIPVNPFLLGFEVKDNIKPILQTLSLHGLDQDMYKLSEVRYPLMQESEQEVEIPGVLSVRACRAGVALQAFDRATGSSNKLGLYRIRMYVDDSLYYFSQLDKITFDQAKYIDGCVDYIVKRQEGKTFELCYQYPGNDADFIYSKGNGIIHLDPGVIKNVRLEAEDFQGNAKTLFFRIKLDESVEEDTVAVRKGRCISVGDSIEIREENIKIQLGPNHLFRNIGLKIVRTEEAAKEPKYAVHEETEPVKAPYSIYIKPETLQEEKMNKAVIVKFDSKNGRISYGGKWLEGYLHTKVKEFGVYGIMYDTIGPTIKPVAFTVLPTPKNRFTFSIRDNLPVRGSMASKMRYRVWIDSVFTISPFSSKNALLEVPLEQLSEGKHHLKIEVIDHSGNISWFEVDFIRKTSMNKARVRKKTS
jgi:hypothetical protein